MDCQDFAQFTKINFKNMPKKLDTIIENQLLKLSVKNDIIYIIYGDVYLL